MSVAVKGGERAIDNAHAWLAEERRGERGIAEPSVTQIRAQLARAANRVMAAGSPSNPDLAALALKQARGDLIGAVFLLRADRTTLPPVGASRPVETGRWRWSGTSRPPARTRPAERCPARPSTARTGCSISRWRRRGGRARTADRARPAGCRAPCRGPAGPRWADRARGALRRGAARSHPRALRLQALPRGDEGFIPGLAHATQRGCGRIHALVGELRTGRVAVELDIPELGFAVEIGELTRTERESLNQFKSSRSEPARFTRGYGLVFGQSGRKAIAMSLVDRALRWRELGEEATDAPAKDEEFVPMHADNVQATGFLEHIRLPRHVEFQSEPGRVRRLRAEAEAGARAEAAGSEVARSADEARDAGAGDCNFACVDEDAARS